ncbi:MAG: terminase TerL endonuclease subunit, partial [Oscillospiraceae bacterium]
HEYGNWDTIRTFQSGFGKRKHSRTFYITTNGYVRGGVLDELTELSQRVLNGEVNDIGFLPLIYKIDKKEEYLDEKMWVKACPSYPYLPTLQKEMKNEFVLMKYQQHVAMDFFTKRMNFCCEDAYTVVATWEQILATNQPIPYEKIEGMQCIGAVDYAQINDFASVGLLFKISGKYILLEHTFVCHKALEIESRKINFPVLEMVERGLITIVKDDVIKGETIADWFLKNSSKYNIIDIFADDFRKSVLDSAFAECGLPLHSVRSGPITHAKIAPLIETIFSQNDLVVGDNPTFRWYVNNTFQEIDGKGNTTYKKIEPKLRKTDGFFMFIHALTKEDKLPNEEANYRSLDVQIY